MHAVILFLLAAQPQEYAGASFGWSRETWREGEATITDTISVGADGRVEIRTLNPACDMVLMEPFTMRATDLERLRRLFLDVRFLDLERGDCSPAFVAAVVPTRTITRRITLTSAQGDAKSVLRRDHSPGSSGEAVGWPDAIDAFFQELLEHPDRFREEEPRDTP